MFRTISTLLLVLLAKLTLAQSIPFEKSYFKGRENEFKSAYQSLNKGYSLMEQGEPAYRLALPYLENAQKFNPDNAQLNLNIGVCMLKTSKMYDALSYFLKAKQLEPAVSSKMEFYVGCGYQLNGDLTNALSSFNAYRSSLDRLNAADIQEVDRRIAEVNNAVALADKPIAVKMENPGANINSPSGDYIPLISADGEKLFFTSRRGKDGDDIDEYDGDFFEDVYFSSLKDGAFLPASNIGAPINSPFHDAAVGVTVDGHSLIIFRGGIGNGDLFVSTNDGFKWSEPVSFGAPVNSNAHESSACFSPDGKFLYFVSDRAGGQGGRDIYVSKIIDGSNKWGEPKNLGPAINTVYDEEGIFMHPDGKTLYFSSKGHNTIGGYDVFVSVLKNGDWSQPINLGMPLNTPGDDVFFQVSADGKTGYFSSYRKEGLGDKDVYKVSFLNSDSVITNLVLLKGIISDASTGSPISAQIEVVDLDTNLTVGKYKNDAKTGEYLISLPAGKNYGTVITADGYLFESQNYDLNDSAVYKEVKRDVKLQSVKKGSEITLNNLFFDSGSTGLKETSVNELNRLLRLMQTYPQLKVEIAGHCDNVGGAAFNQDLSEKRARAVKDFLVKHAIQSERLTSNGYGYTKPLADNDTEEGRAKNRRIELIIISE
jgi:outer membrane protein OmpA-like peptidoglycan-associated protein/tetratricopeptide (TPR) repeat protein